jgi:hypothetical protein
MSRSIVSRATFDGDNCIAITVQGHNKKKKTDYIYSRPYGTWTEMTFTREEDFTYVEFLKGMVVKNIDVHRKLALLAHERVVDHPEHHIQMMNAIRILDKTFWPPTINLRCRWQREFMYELVNNFTICVIATGRNTRRLGRYFSAMEDICIHE